MQNAWGQILTAGGSTIWIVNRTYSGTATAANYMEQPTLSQTSGAVTAFITSPRQRDMLIEPGRYLQDDRLFHVASGAIANQFDYVQIAGTGDFYVVSEIPAWVFQGGQIKERIHGRRIKVN